MTAIDKSPLIIGHRGASALAPENTLAAFTRALRDGAAGIELDVRLSRDGIPVVIHDATLRAGLRKRFVSRMTAAELQEDPGPAIPTLDDVFSLLNDQPNRESIVYVELKCGRSRKKNEELAGETLHVISRHRFGERVIVISFNHRIVARVKELNPSIRTGALFGPRPAPLRSAAKIISAANRCQANELCLHHRVITREVAAAADLHNLPIIIWTVDNPKWLARARQLGVHAVMTNNPAILLAA